MRLLVMMPALAGLLLAGCAAPPDRHGASAPMVKMTGSRLPQPAGAADPALHVTGFDPWDNRHDPTDPLMLKNLGPLLR